MTYRTPDRPIPWQSVKPFKPSKTFSEAQENNIIGRLAGNGVEPETPEDMLSRVAPSYRVALLNLIAERGEG
jgi:hypothetical protein